MWNGVQISVFNPYGGGSINRSFHLVFLWNLRNRKTLKIARQKIHNFKYYLVSIYILNIKKREWL